MATETATGDSHTSGTDIHTLSLLALTMIFMLPPLLLPASPALSLNPPLTFMPPAADPTSPSQNLHAPAAALRCLGGDIAAPRAELAGPGADLGLCPQILLASVAVWGRSALISLVPFVGAVLFV